MEINISRIRDEMKNRNQWLCWEAAMRDGKETKLPKNPKTGDFAQTDDPSTWGSFMNALGKVREGDMDGVGFVFTEDDNYVGIDLDDCRDPETGEFDDWALDVMRDVGGWIEISPSGTGAHIILKGEIPGDRNRKGDIEMYEKGRFFTITGQLVDEDGNRLGDSDDTPEINHAQQALDAVYDRFLAEEDESANDTEVDVDNSEWGHLDLETPDEDATKNQSGGPDLESLPEELQELVGNAKSAGNGYQFTQLWRGNWKSDYPSHSEADMAFCDMLAFWLSGDPEWMDQVFRASGLMRRKWDDVRYADGSTYGERTIEKAIAKVDDHYNPDHYDSIVDESTSNEDGQKNGTETENEIADTGGEKKDSKPANNSPSSSSGEQKPEAEKTRRRDRSRRRKSRRKRSTNNERGSDGEAEDNEKSEPTTSNESNEDDVHNIARGRNRGRGRRGQKRRDGIPDDVVGSGTTKTQNQDHTNAEDDTEEEYYTEFNFETDGIDDTSEPQKEANEELETTDRTDEERSEDDIDITRDDAKSIFDDFEGNSTSSSSTSSQDYESGATAEIDSELGNKSTSTAASQDVDGSKDNSTANTDRDPSQSQATKEETYDTETEDVDEDEEISPSYQQRIEHIEIELKRLQEDLRTAKAQLKHDVELEDDKLERIYRELQQYEEIVDRREQQLETTHQLLILLCHVQPEPVFDKIESILHNSDSIPEEDIFDKPPEEIFSDPESPNDTVDNQSPQENTATKSPTERNQQERSPRTEDSEAEEDERTFLSSFF